VGYNKPYRSFGEKKIGDKKYTDNCALVILDLYPMLIELHIMF